VSDRRAYKRNISADPGLWMPEEINQSHEDREPAEGQKELDIDIIEFIPNRPALSW
jgi:hypothetical protein